MDGSTRALRRDVFTKKWPIDADLTAIAATLPTHRFLENPAGQYAYIYLLQYVKALAERHTGKPFRELKVLDWGCGKGHVTKLLRDLAPAQIDSCDILSDKDDSAFGQQTPIIAHYNIDVKPLEHDYILPYSDASFDIVLSVGVLEHVPNDRASLAEINRVLKPGGLFFCFYLPTKFSWTQAIAHRLGNNYHDRLYTKDQVRQMLSEAGLQMIDFWYRQLLPKNTVNYPNFRLFERFDQLITEYTPLRHFATNIEFVGAKPR